MENLTSAQRDAIEHLHGPMLVVAGAGTGKTTVLVKRVAQLIVNHHARPGEILATTYTRNAAAELRDRVRAATGSAAGDIQACTFHSYCAQLLQDNRCGFGLLDGPDLWIYLRRRLGELGLRHYTRAVDPGEFLHALLDFFARCHDELVDVADYERYLEELAAGAHPLPRVLPGKQNSALTREQVLERCREIAGVYRKVEQMLSAANLGAYGHMVLRAVKLLRARPALLEAARARARFILIDEFQDANLAQIELAQLLAGDECNLFAVGDPDQAIYRFRGASSAAFEEFTRRFPQAAGVILEDNQRSGGAVLECSFAVISHNPAARCRVGCAEFQRRALASARQKRAAAEGRSLLLPPVGIVVCPDAETEAADVAQAIAALRPEPRLEPRDGPRFGVLYRAHSNRDALVLELAARKIPFRVKGVNALETASVRDLLACLRVLRSPADYESLFRLAALPGFGLDGACVREQLAACRDADFVSVLESIPGGAAVLAALRHARGLAAAADMRIIDAIGICIAAFGLDAADPGIAAFRSFAAQWREKPFVAAGDLAEFLDYMDWFAQAPGAMLELPLDAAVADPEAVCLMTVHAAKGLEFDHVFALRLTHNTFPARYRPALFEFPAALRRSLVAAGDDPEIHREEERRLLYVAMTRARDSLALSTRVGTGRNPRPTAFVRELMDAPAARQFWQTRAAVPPAFDIHAAAAPLPAGLSAWLLAPPSVRLVSPSLSAGSVEAYETCPLKFKLLRDWNIPGPAAAAVQYGNAVHRVLGDYYAAHLQARARTLDEVLRLFRAIMAGTRFDDPLQRDMYERQGVEQLTAFVALRRQEPPPAVLRVEQSFQLNIGNVVVKGRIDRMDRIEGRRIAVVDYKTGKPQDAEKARHSLQLTLYALVARDTFGFIPERLAFYNLENQTLVSATRSDGDFDEARQRVLAVAAGVAAGDFAPRPDFHCRWCEYRNLCPATEQKLYALERAVAAN